MKDIISGPNIYDMFHDPPWYRVFAVGVAAVSVVSTLYISASHYCRLRSTGELLKKKLSNVESDADRLTRLLLVQRRRLLVTITCMLPLYGIGYFAPVLCPRSKFLAELLRHIAEAFSLEAFLLLLVDLLGGEAESNAALAMLPPQRFFVVPPLGCFFRCCPCVPFPPCAPRPWTSKTMTVALNCGRQFKVVVISVAFNILFLQLNFLSMSQEERHSEESMQVREGHVRYVVTVFERVEKVSMLVCLYSLFILYKATKDFLEHLHSHLMFLSLKCPLIVALLQEQLLFVLVRNHVIRGDAVLYAQEQADVIHCVLGGIWTLLAAILVTRAFPTSLLTIEGQRAHVGEVGNCVSSLVESGESYTECRSLGPVQVG